MANRCLHCNLETIPSEKFCCQGCESAYHIINDLGLDNYYKNRILDPDIKALKPDEECELDLSQFINQNENGTKSIYLLIDGLHCAACVWLIESVLKRQKNVVKARINMSGKKLHLCWDGDDKYGNHLVKMINDLGYKLIPFDFEILQSQEKKYNNDLLKALSVAGFAAGNLMLISVALWSSSTETMGVATRNLLYWVSALIALPAIIYSGRIFFNSAARAIKNRATNMDVPISVAIILVSIISIFDVINKAEHAYFDSAVMLIFFLLIGRYLDFSVRKKALSITSDLMSLSAGVATVIDGDNHKIISTKDVKIGMILLIKKGEKIVADGVIIKGKSEIDSSLINGESIPKNADIGDEVFAGTINLGENIEIEVKKDKNHTLLSQIVNLVENFEHKKGKYVTIADQLSKYYTPIVHILAFLTFTLWFYYFNSDLSFALSSATAVLIITCPCALALAVPVVQTLAGSNLMKQGILLKSGAALEKLADVNTIIFDKTGTLTQGNPSLIDSFLWEDGRKNPIDNNHQLFQIAASIASKSGHPLSKALVNSSNNKLLNIDQISEKSGLGLSGKYLGKEVKLGKKEWVLSDSGNQELLVNNKNLVIYLKYDQEVVIFIFEDNLREDSSHVISVLKNSGKKVILLSGDHESVVKDVAARVNIEEYYFSQTPIQKCSHLRNFQKKYGKILMVGDGLNDAPALALSDVSISPAKSSDITKNAADIIFQGAKLSPILTIINTAKKSRSLMHQNFFIAIIYNIIAIPFAIAGYIVPLIAALSMSASSILVILNSVLQFKKKSKL